MSDLIQDTETQNFDSTSTPDQTLKMETKDIKSQDDLNIILKNFTSKNGKNMKKESLNIIIIRAIRRVLKFLVKSRIPKTTSIFIDPKNIEQNLAWNELIILYSYNFELFNEMIGKNNSESLNRNYLKLENSEITKLNFMKSFYNIDEVKQVYAQLIKIFFSVFKPNDISRRLGLHCCRKYNHSDKCNDKWKILKSYLEDHYLSDLMQCNNQY